jgi:hypothetical protein
MIRKLSRRHVLRGAGVALALPWLEAMGGPRAARAQETAIKRFLHVYFPNGATTLWWRTTGTGAGDAWQLSPLLQPFEPFKEKMLMLRQLGNFTWRKDLLTMSPAWTTYRERNDFCGICRMPSGAYVLPSHSRAPSALLNCMDGDAYRQSKGQNIGTSPMNGETVDQLLARTLPKETALASMQLGLFNGNGGLDERHSAMSRNMSWDQNGTALGKDLDPAHVFDQLVATGAGQTTTDPEAEAAAARRRALDLSALDSLSDSATALKARLGASDNERLDRYLTGVRELELKTQAVVRPEPNCTAATIPGNTSDATVRSRAMNDLIVMALECDVTRIVTYMLDNSRSDLVYSWVPRRDFENGGAMLGGTATAYHESQHHTGTSPDFASITRWHIEAMADLLTKMDAIQEPSGGTLLDNSALIFCSDMHHGDHAAFDLPFLMFGSGSGTFRQNELVMLPEGIEDIRQMRDVHFTILKQYFGLDVATFGEDMRGTPNQLLSQILA